MALALLWKLNLLSLLRNEPAGNGSLPRIRGSALSSASRSRQRPDHDAMSTIAFATKALLSLACVCAGLSHTGGGAPSHLRSGPTLSMAAGDTVRREELLSVPAALGGIGFERIAADS